MSSRIEAQAMRADDAEYLREQQRVDRAEKDVLEERIRGLTCALALAGQTAAHEQLNAARMLASTEARRDEQMNARSAAEARLDEVRSIVEGCGPYSIAARLQDPKPVVEVVREFVAAANARRVAMADVGRIAFEALSTESKSGVKRDDKPLSLVVRLADDMRDLRAKFHALDDEAEAQRVRAETAERALATIHCAAKRKARKARR